MSQLVKQILAYKYDTYFFKIALDHAPEQGEVDDIVARIQGAMKALGVPPEQVGVTVFKSVLPAGAEAPQEEEMETVRGDMSYLLCILIRTEEGGFTEETDIIAERTIRAFATFAEMPAENVAAVVLEDAYLEVETRKSVRTPMV